MGVLSRLLGRGQVDTPAAMTVSYRRVVVEGEHPVECRGESHYRAGFVKVLGPGDERGFEEELVVDLVREPKNPYDANAVGAHVDGVLLAYVARESAAVLAPALDRALQRGVQIACRGVVVGGWDRGDGDQGHFGLTLVLPAPEAIIAAVS